MEELITDRKKIEAHMRELSEIGRLGEKPEDGFLRAAWSIEETQAMIYIKNQADLGLDVRFDEIGNLFITTPGKREFVQVGSHLDTVPCGGNYDGVVGIVAGLEALQTVRKQETKRGIELVVWRGEEGATFGGPYKGSRAAFGVDQRKVLENEFDNQTLESAILGQGYNPVFIEEARPTLTQKEIDSIYAHLELHIEQAKNLERRNKDIGVVTAIRGCSRYLVVVRGEFDHSGATAMNHRRDANLAIARMQVELDNLRRHYNGNDLVQTIGVINTSQEVNKEYADLVYSNSITKVSGFGYFMLDIRSTNNSFREIYEKIVIGTIEEVASEYDVEVDISKTNSADAIEHLDEEIVRRTLEASNALGYATTKMISGAGHDVAEVSKQKRSDGSYIPTGLIFIPCRNGISHDKKEFTTIDAIHKGANVLANVMYSLAR